MNIKTDVYLWEQNLNFQVSEQSKLTVKTLDLALTEQNQEIVECRLTFRVNFQDYQQIEQNNWFNLTEEVKHPTYGGQLNPDQDVEIELALHPEILTELLDIASQAKGCTNYLAQLSQNNIDSPFLKVENWFLLYAKQELELPTELAEEGSSLKVGYSTDYADEIEQGRKERDQDSEDFAPENDNYAHGSMFDLMINFFQKKGVDYTRLKLGDADLLRLEFQGTKYQWDCYAQSNEQYHECSFYSVCPEKIAEEKRADVNEFLTRANYGMTVGNFEMNLDTGEVRCKTSIDLEGNMLNFSLLNRLMEVNVCLMERYLQGIMLIIQDNVSPKEAIMLVE